MNYTFKTATAVILSCILTLSLNSCKKDEEGDEGKLPNISFQAGNGNIISDATIAKATPFNTAIVASKSEDKDVLKKFIITRKYDSGNDSTIYMKDLSDNEGDNFSYQYTGTTRNFTGSEMYTFTIVNRDGLINKISLKLTVQ